MIDVKHGDRGAPSRREADENGAVPLEMALPALATGIEKANDLARNKISAAQVWSLMEVASVATPAAILQRIAAAMLLGEDMFDVEAGRRSSRVREPAVLAALPAPDAHDIAQGPCHGVADDRFSRARAFACSMAMKSMK